MSAMRGSTLTAVLAALALAVPAARAEAGPEACALLSDGELGRIQGEAPAARVASEQAAGDFQLRQCFYRSRDFARSVSLAVAVPRGDRQDGPREYWRQRFQGQSAAAPPAGKKKREAPVAIVGLGDEAYWTTDPAAGVLYVLAGEVFLRISIGGPPEARQRAQRAEALARHALARLAPAPRASSVRQLPRARAPRR